MIIKKYTGKTEAEATEAAKKELGSGLVIMNTKKFAAWLNKYVWQMGRDCISSNTKIEFASAAMRRTFCRLLQNRVCSICTIVVHITGASCQRSSWRRISGFSVSSTASVWCSNRYSLPPNAFLNSCTFCPIIDRNGAT